MKRKKMWPVAGIVCILILFFSCKKEKASLKENSTINDTLTIKDTLFRPDSLLGKDTVNGCIIPMFVPFQPYENPVWHPGAQILGFNYSPLASIYKNQVGNQPSCFWYSYLKKQDSVGFYIMNKNGTGLKRVTDFKLSAPAWSPDGNWLAFSLGPQIYKMRFMGTGFDTANIIQLTNDGANFFPSWTANGDTIYYDSNMNAPTGTSFYSIWKMSNNGTGKVQLTQTAGVGDTRQPFVGPDNKIYFTKYVSGHSEIFSMNKDGTNQLQFSNNGFNVKTPKYWQGKLFYEENQIGVVLSMGSKGVQLTYPAVTYDISTSGEIVYSKMEYSILIYNKQIGTLWIMNADGTNNRQLTFNNF